MSAHPAPHAPMRPSWQFKQAIMQDTLRSASAAPVQRMHQAALASDLALPLPARTAFGAALLSVAFLGAAFLGAAGARFLVPCLRVKGEGEG